jgi:hypothetical protein
VDFVITDSPILLGGVYSDNKELRDLLYSHYCDMNNIDILMVRGDYFEEEGRIHNLDESIKVDNKVGYMLKELNIPYHIYTCSRDNVSLIADIVEGREVDYEIRY